MSKLRVRSVAEVGKTLKENKLEEQEKKIETVRERERESEEHI